MKKTHPYHRLLPRGVQEALRRAATIDDPLARLIAIEDVTTKTRFQSPQFFRSEP